MEYKARVTPRRHPPAAPTGEDQVVTEKYFTKLGEQLKKLGQRIEASLQKAVNKVVLRDLVDLEGKATVQVMYGETTFKLNQSSLNKRTTAISKYIATASKQSIHRCTV